jgi:hypothetical protein
MYRWSIQIGEVMPSRRTVLRNSKLDDKGRLLKSKPPEAPESAPAESAKEEKPAEVNAPEEAVSKKVAAAPKKAAEVARDTSSKHPEEKKVQAKPAPSTKKSKKSEK